MIYQDNLSNDTYPILDEVVEESISTAYQSDSNVHQELDNLEDIIEEGVHVPLTDLVMVDEGIILDRVKSIKKHLPTALAISIEVLQHQQEIIQTAKNQAQKIVKSAQDEAERLLQESAILRKIELEANKIRFETEQECEKLRQAAYQEIEQWRETAAIEYEEIQRDADNYANSVLGDLETRLTQMLTVVQNGRQHLQPNNNQESSQN
jgi:cell division septum initiation protein DivIVA